MNDSVWVFAGAALTMMLAGCIQNMLGFGYAMVAMSTLPWMMGIREANVLVAICSLLPLAYGAWQCQQDLSWKAMRIAVFGALIGLPIGLFVFRFAEASWLLRMTGMVILGLVMHVFYQDWRWPRRIDPETADPIEAKAHIATGETISGLAIAGLFSGALAGAIGIGGPPIAAYAINRRWSVAMTRGFLLTFAFTLAVLRCGGLVAAGWIGTTELLQCSVAVPCSVVGGIVGVRFAAIIHPVLFRRLTLSALSILALGMIL